MELKEALIQIKKIPSVLEAFKSVDELLSLVLEKQGTMDELKTKIQNLRQEDLDLSKLKEDRECLIRELKTLRGQKGTVFKELNDLRSELAALKAQILA